MIQGLRLVFVAKYLLNLKCIICRLSDYCYTLCVNFFFQLLNKKYLSTCIFDSTKDYLSANNNYTVTKKI